MHSTLLIFTLQLAALQEVQHQAGEMDKENKRLSQEIKENQQMISVLEMERDVLSKSVILDHI